MGDKLFKLLVSWRSVAINPRKSLSQQQLNDEFDVIVEHAPNNNKKKTRRTSSKNANNKDNADKDEDVPPTKRKRVLLRKTGGVVTERDL